MQCSTPNGHFSIVAIDHRANLQSALNKHAANPITDDEFKAFKRQVIRALAPEASAILSDPIYGLDGCFEPPHRGLLVPLELTNYDVHPSRRDTAFIPDWTVAKAKRLGASGIKLLLYFHPDDATAEEKKRVVAEIVDECSRVDMPFFLEPIAYSPDPQRSLTNPELLQVVVESARLFSSMGVDVLKLEFPVNVSEEPDERVWGAAAQEVNRACGVPWALLSAGVPYEVFRKQAEIACRAGGACGIIAGRAVWGEAVELQGADRQQFLETTARQRVIELGRICAAHARSWMDLVETPDFSPHWYSWYAEIE
jgi:tagatose-1,6-bisphosphate aldolase